MIERLRLKNWQCHLDRTVTLGPVTVLCGDNGSGKSSVLRALKFAALNDWDGAANDHVSWGADDSEVELVAEGRTLLRQKGKAKNLYLLDGEPLAAFHPHVPKGVEDFLRLTKVNFSDQTDPAYWVSLSGAEAAAALNDLFDLSAIDSTAEAVGRELRQAKARVTAAQERLEKAEGIVVELQWAEEADTLLTDLGGVGQELDSLDTEIQRMNQVLRKLHDLEQTSQLSGEALAAGLEALACGEEVLALDEQIDKLRGLLKLEESDRCLRKTLKQKEALLAKWLAGQCPLCQRNP